MDSTVKVFESKIKLLNEFNQFKVVNFICVGIGFGLPTSLSMHLNAHYINGSNEIHNFYSKENAFNYTEIYTKVASLKKKRELIKVNLYVIIIN